MTLKERLKTVGSSLAKYKAACASVVRGKVRWLHPRFASTTPGPSKRAPRLGQKHIIIAMATVIIGIGAIAFIFKGHPIAAMISRSAKPSSPMKSHVGPPKPKPAEAPGTKLAEAPAPKLAEAPAPKLAEAPATKLAEPPAPKLAANSPVAQRMMRSCENLAKPRPAVESGTGADVYAVAVCKQFGMWRQGQLTVTRID